MQTWLDWYANLILKSSVQADFAEKKMGTAKVTLRRSMDGFPADPMGKLRQQFANAMNIWRKRPLGTTPEIVEMCQFQAFLNPFVRPVPVPVVAASLDRDAVRSLIEGNEAAEYDGVLYVDFDHGACMLGDGIQLRALFVVPVNGPFFVAVVGVPGCNTGVRIVWQPGNSRIAMTDSMDIRTSDVRPEWLTVVNEQRGLIENLAWQTVSRIQNEEGNPGPADVLHGENGESQPEQKETLFTLFSVKRLTAANVRNHKPCKASGIGTSKRRHPVKEHPRWQAYGKGWSKRRLIQVKSHERGDLNKGQLNPLHVLH